MSAPREGAIHFFATAAKGTEPALRDELREHRFPRVRADRGGVHFEGPMSEGYRACLLLRSAGRVLAEVGHFDARGGDALYAGIHAIEWGEHIDAARTLAVRAVCRSSELTHSQFIAQKTKDAIVDQTRERTGARPSVDLQDPDVLVFVHLVKDVATAYLDLGGVSLHRRGYRVETVDAPLKEHLAAAVLRISGWDRSSPLVDPMCGSGTIPIEAALWAAGVAPGLAHERFGFERWASFDDAARKTLADLRAEAEERVRPTTPPIFGFDIDERAIAVARANALEAGARVVFERRSVAHLAPLDPPGFVVTNPPYGERLVAGAELHAAMGAAFRRMHGHTVSVLAGSPAIARAIPMRPTGSHALWNGDIECRLLTYSVQ